MKKIVILISGKGSNLRAILNAQRLRGGLSEVSQVISNRPNAQGILVAREFGVPLTVLDHVSFSSRTQFDEALMALIDSYQPDLVLLAGFMRLLSDQFVDHFMGKLMNIHPSLLPSFPGLKTHQQALSTGVKWHGATVHFVTREMDVGPIIAQGIVPVCANDTEDDLARRVLEIEHIIYPQAIEWFLKDQLLLENGIVRVSPEQSQYFYHDQCCI